VTAVANSANLINLYFGIEFGRKRRHIYVNTNVKLDVRFLESFSS